MCTIRSKRKSIKVGCGSNFASLHTFNFSAEAADHSYDDVYQVTTKNVGLFRENGNAGRDQTKEQRGKVRLSIF
jgi:hypothetical protein